MARSPALAIAIGALVATGCGPAETTTSGTAPIERTETDQWGLITCSEATPDRTCYTHRAIMGVSMGASGAGQLGFERPDLFDGVGMLGIPMLDWTYMLRNFERAYLGGFCDRETILANLDRVNDPDGPAFCGAQPGVVKLEPSGRMLEPEQDFNHWYRWIKAGRGGTFGRDKLRESFQDISLAFGNANYYNEASPYFPPGVPMDYRGRRDPDRCATPVVVRGLKHKEYNPDGTYDMVVTCDSDKIPDKEGDFDPTRPNRFSFEMLLSVDYNGNGQRDYAEPVITMSRERWQDTGTKPNDAYDWDTNPSGTAGNWLYDEGEPFEDTGLDGVPGTGDYGEGNGKYDYSPNVLNYFAQNPRHLIRSMPDGHLDRLSIWADAGLRDFLASAAGSNWFWGELRNRLGGEKVRDYTTFRSLPGAERDYDFLAVDYSSEGIGKHAYVRYGDPDASQRDIDRGDGHHVGPADQLLDRFLTSLSFLQSRFYEPDIRAANEVGDPNELIEPQTYYSEALGEERPFGIVFPPGYFDPANAEKRYPVVYLLHGQGQESDDLLASAILFFGYMAASNDTLTQRKFQSDWAKFIMVFPDSRCRRGECDGGNFNANHPGMDGNGPRFKDAVFELMAHVEKNFRVRRPVEVPR
jgi:hypothetical protein